MTLADAGPLIAMLDRDDRDHVTCVAAQDELTSPLVTTWPVFTEAMCLLGDRTGPRPPRKSNLSRLEGGPCRQERPWRSCGLGSFGRQHKRAKDNRLEGRDGASETQVHFTGPSEPADPSHGAASRGDR